MVERLIQRDRSGDDCVSCTGTSAAHPGPAERAVQQPFEQACQQESPNWYTGQGGVDEFGLRLHWCRFVATHCLNAIKVFAAWR